MEPFRLRFRRLACLIYLPRKLGLPEHSPFFERSVTGFNTRMMPPIAILDLPEFFIVIRLGPRHLFFVLVLDSLDLGSYFPSAN